MHPLHLPCRSRVKVKVDESMTERIEVPAMEFVGIIARRLVRGMPMPVRALTRNCAPLSSAQSTYCTCRHVFTGIACGALVLNPAPMVLPSRCTAACLRLKRWTVTCMESIIDSAVLFQNRGKSKILTVDHLRHVLFFASQLGLV